MGCSSTTKTITSIRQPSNIQIKVMIDKLYQYAQITKERHSNEGLQWELQLQQMLNNKQRDKDLEYQLFSKLCYKDKYLQTLDFIIQYCQILSNQTHMIGRFQGQAQQIQYLMGYIESIIYASNKINFDHAKQFNEHFLFYFQLDQNNLKNVTPEILTLHQTLFPSGSEINYYAKKFAQKYGFSQNHINQVGNQFQIEDKNPPQFQISPNVQFQNQLNYPPQSEILNNNQNAQFNQEGREIISGNPYYQINPGLINQQNQAFNLNPQLQPQRPNIKLNFDQKQEKQ